MLFNSLGFSVFLPIVFILYWILPHKLRWPLLLLAGYFFYACWNPIYVLLLFVTTLITYLCGRILYSCEKQTKKNTIIVITVALCVGILFLFKYYNFTIGSVSWLFNRISLSVVLPVSHLLLPIGISFYVFKSISYIVDVYKGKMKAEKHFGYYATYVSFFPQLAAGPIDRAISLIPQLKEEKKFEYENGVNGLKKMAWGYFKKMAVSDLLAVYVNAVFGNVREYTGFSLCIAAVLFSVQIYCDFSGYSDIAIGTCQLLGIRVADNFKYPYFAASVKEFWDRWHISLSTWFRDYVYIPLGGSRCSKWKQYRNLLITFLLSGLWHGANWTFVFWGAIHGIALIVERIFHKSLTRLRNRRGTHFICICFVFLFCTLAWVFFKANSFSDAIYLIGHSLQGITTPLSYLRQGFIEIGIDMPGLFRIGFGILLLFTVDYVQGIKQKNILAKVPLIPRWILYYVFVIIVIYLASFSVSGDFIYFQF